MTRSTFARGRLIPKKIQNGGARVRVYAARWFGGFIRLNAEAMKSTA